MTIGYFGSCITICHFSKNHLNDNTIGHISGPCLLASSSLLRVGDYPVSLHCCLSVANLEHSATDLFDQSLILSVHLRIDLPRLLFQSSLPSSILVHRFLARATWPKYRNLRLCTVASSRSCGCGWRPEGSKSFLHLFKNPCNVELSTGTLEWKHRITVTCSYTENRTHRYMISPTLLWSRPIAR